MHSKHLLELILFIAFSISSSSLSIVLFITSFVELFYFVFMNFDISFVISLCIIYILSIDVFFHFFYFILINLVFSHCMHYLGKHFVNSSVFETFICNMMLMGLFVFFSLFIYSFHL